MYESCTRRRWKRRYQILFQLITHLLPNVRFAYKFGQIFASSTLSEDTLLLQKKELTGLLWPLVAGWRFLGGSSISHGLKRSIPFLKNISNELCMSPGKKKKGSGAGGGLGITFHGPVSFWSTCWASLRVIFLTKDWALKDTSTFRAGTSNCKLKLRKVLCSSAAWTNWINLPSFKVREVVFCHVPVLIS